MRLKIALRAILIDWKDKQGPKLTFCIILVTLNLGSQFLLRLLCRFYCKICKITHFCRMALALIIEAIEFFCEIKIYAWMMNLKFWINKFTSKTLVSMQKWRMKWLKTLWEQKFDRGIERYLCLLAYCMNTIIFSSQWE